MNLRDRYMSYTDVTKVLILSCTSNKSGQKKRDVITYMLKEYEQNVSTFWSTMTRKSLQCPGKLLNDFQYCGRGVSFTCVCVGTRGRVLRVAENLWVGDTILGTTI